MHPRTRMVGMSWYRSLVLVGMLLPMMASAQQPLKVYAAGSLVAPLKQVIEASGLPASAVGEPVFGPAGLLRQRLADGEPADLYLSANLAHPRSLRVSRRARLVVPFARNDLCLLSRESPGATAGAIVDRLLDPAFRLATSTPGADPGGDYAWQVFEKAEALRPGAREALQAKALKLMGSPGAMVPVAGKSVPASIFLADNADGLIYYCSGQAQTLREVPGLVSTPLPPSIAVTAVYGLALLSDRPEAMRLALFLLSDEGQAILAANGLLPVLGAP